jgi:hypothetical protein
MNDRSLLWLLLIPLSLPPQAANAQIRSVGGPGTTQPAKRSHLDLPDGPDMDNAQEVMADRLRELHELHQLQDQVQELLQDPEFVERLKKIPNQDLQRLREKILNGNGLRGDETWKNLLDQASSSNRLNQHQINLLKRWAERSENSIPMQTPTGPSPGVTQPPTSSSSQPATMQPGRGGFVPTPAPKETSWWERMQAKSADWIKDHADDLGNDLADAIYDFAGTNEGAPLADVLRTLKTPDFSGGGLAEPASNLANHLPDVGAFLHKQRGIWDEMGSIFRHARDASMSRVGGGPRMSSLPSAPSARGDDRGNGAFMLLSLAVLLLLFWKLGGWSKLQTGRAANGAWQLGPWPVRPGAVSTRQDLVRAFEYLALLSLGRDASTCHHRELAARLAGRDDMDDARRRQAADLLAWLYEQARYAPAEESLSAEEMTEARHALCFLAGVPAA